MEDFDAATLDPATGNMKAEFVPNSQMTQLPWDYLHPNHAGYPAMGEAIDLSVLRLALSLRQASVWSFGVRMPGASIGRSRGVVRGGSIKRSGPLWGRSAWFEALAYAVDDLVELAGDRRILRHAAGVLGGGGGWQSQGVAIPINVDYPL